MVDLNKNTLHPHKHTKGILVCGRFLYNDEVEPLH